MKFNCPSKSVLVLITVLILGFLHTIPLWNTQVNLAAGYGDPLSHATMGQYYCINVLSSNFHTDRLLAPFGTEMSGSYDSPFPFFLTCPALSAGPIFQFHFFALLQIWLILFGSWLVATYFFKTPVRQLAYILCVWWCGFYIARSHQHVTLLSVIWGTQFVFFAIMSMNLKKLGSVLRSALLLGLSYAGTFQNIPGLIILTLSLAGYKLWQDREDLKDIKVVRNIILGLVLALVVFLGLWWPMIAYTLKNGPVLVDGQRRFYSLDLLSPFIPHEMNRLFNWWPTLPKLSLERENSFDLLILALVLVSAFSKKFWKDSFRLLLLVIGVIYFILALGPELQINGELIAYLDFNSEIFSQFPMRITRTPGRLAAITSMCLVLIAFIYLENLSHQRFRKYISGVLVIWAIIIGPWMNQMWFFPTLKYSEILPAKALAEVRKLPESVTVVPIPTGWARDPSQNFMQIFHNKRISSGYLAYTNYNQKVQEQFSTEPFLGRLGCEGESTAFAMTPLFANSNELRSYLLKNQYQAFIINKNLLMSDSACTNLTSWLKSFIQLPWVKSLEENNLFIVLTIQ